MPYDTKFSERGFGWYEIQRCLLASSCQFPIYKKRSEIFSKMKNKYAAFGVSLTQGQKTTVAKAVSDGTGATIWRLTHGQHRGDDNLGITKRQAGHIAKNIDEGGGVG